MANSSDREHSSPPFRVSQRRAPDAGQMGNRPLPHGRLASSLLSFSRRSAYIHDADDSFAIYQSPTAAYYITAK
jgi:hypothetical protein